MRVFSLLLAGLLAVATPAAAEDAPEFLLGDLDVRVDLPRGWNMSRWSDWDFKASTGDPILLEAWSTEVQTDPSKVDAKVWDALMQDKLDEMGAGEGITLDKAKVETIQGQPMALLDYSFQLKGGQDAVMRSGSLAIEGKMFHLALVSIKRFKKKVDNARGDLLDRLEIRTGPADVAWAPTLSGTGFEHTLPEDWREPLEAEQAVVTKQTSKFGVEDVSQCWTAMRPKGPGAPDAMLACQGGMMLGVVDSYSFEGVEPVVREKVVGSKDIAPAKQVELSDRVAFVYDLADKGLAIGVVPFGNGVVRVWVKGEAGDAGLVEALEATLKAGTYEGTHPASIGEQVSYYVAYRPTSPVVLGPAFLLLLLVGGGVAGGAMMMGGTKNKYEDLDD